MKHGAYPFCSPKRLTPEKWKALIQEWVAVKNGKLDHRHNGDLSLWRQDAVRLMPLTVQSESLALFACETEDAEALEVVYCGITDSAHIAYLNTHNLCPNQITFDAIIAFRKRFNLPFERDTLSVLVRRALEIDSPALFERIPGLDEATLLATLHFNKELLEFTGPTLAPWMADFLKGWARYSAQTLLSIFLDCANHGYVKSLNAILSTGLNPFEVDQGKNTSFRPVNYKRLHNYLSPIAAEVWPQSFIETLEILDPDTPTSNHRKLSRIDLLTEEATIRLLSLPRDTPSAGLDPHDWSCVDRKSS